MMREVCAKPREVPPNQLNSNARDFARSICAKLAAREVREVSLTHCNRSARSVRDGARSLSDGEMGGEGREGPFRGPLSPSLPILREVRRMT